MNHLYTEYTERKDGSRDMGGGKLVCSHCGQKEPFSLAGQSIEFAPLAFQAITKAFTKQHSKCPAPPEGVRPEELPRPTTFEMRLEMPRR
jgi:hypothetical protein